MVRVALVVPGRKITVAFETTASPPRAASPVRATSTETVAELGASRLKARTVLPAFSSTLEVASAKLTAGNGSLSRIVTVWV